jgi:hypothetical protein
MSAIESSRGYFEYFPLIVSMISHKKLTFIKSGRSTESVLCQVQIKRYALRYLFLKVIFHLKLKKTVILESMLY